MKWIKSPACGGIEEDGQGSDGKGVYFQRDFCLHDEPDPVDDSQISGQPLGGNFGIISSTTPSRCGCCGAVDSSAVLFAADNSSKHAHSAADIAHCSTEYESGCMLTFGIARVLFVQPYYYLAKSGWHIYLFRMADELSDADINAYRAQNAERKGKR